MEHENEVNEDIRANLEAVREKISRAAQSVGRKTDDVCLVVVSKEKPLALVEAAIHAGAKDFGENYPERAIDKIDALKQYTDVKWHMIGHLQSRKTDLVVSHFDFMHSLDSVKLARKLGNGLIQAKKTLRVLLEFNVASEESKSGWNAGNESAWDRLLPDVAAILEQQAIHVCGLMCMPPFSENAEDSRSYFVRLIKLRDYFCKHFPSADLTELSMGTSFDYEVAVQEGATIVRVGQAILGPRACSMP